MTCRSTYRTWPNLIYRPNINTSNAITHHPSLSLQRMIYVRYQLLVSHDSFWKKKKTLLFVLAKSLIQLRQKQSAFFQNKTVFCLEQKHFCFKKRHFSLKQLLDNCGSNLIHTSLHHLDISCRYVAIVTVPVGLPMGKSPLTLFVHIHTVTMHGTYG